MVSDGLWPRSVGHCGGFEEGFFVALNSLLLWKSKSGKRVTVGFFIVVRFGIFRLTIPM